MGLKLSVIVHEHMHDVKGHSKINEIKLNKIVHFIVKEQSA